MTIRYILGEKRITNDYLSEKFPKWKKGRFEKRVGIYNRFKSSLTSLELATKIFINERRSEQNLIYVTQTNQFSIPGDAFVYANLVGLNVKEVIQISSGCSGFVDALNLAFNFENNLCSIICTDTYQSIVDQEEASNLILFSDCASLTQINMKEYSKVYYDTLIDTGNYSKIQRQNRKHDFFKMEGKEVYNFVLERVLPFIISSLAGKNVEVLYLHQANRMMLDIMKEEIHKIYPNIVIPIFIEDGNCVSSSIPKVMFDENKFNTYESIAMCGFGVGLKASLIIINRK
jgi:3-oxoacyl-[acyl-carrier-protein] synthase-3